MAAQQAHPADTLRSLRGRLMRKPLEERVVPEREVYLTIISGKSVIGAYDYYGDARVGFWHPDYELFVAWKPDAPTRLVSVFHRKDGEEYLRSNLQATPIRKG